MALNVYTGYTDELAAATTQYIEKEVPDGLAKAIPIWNYLAKDGKEQCDGGRFIQFDLKAYTNNSQAFIHETGATIDVTPSRQLIPCQLNWKYSYMAINFTLMDETIANGKHDAIRYFDQKTSGALADFYRMQGAAIWGTSATNALMYEGMQDILAASGTSYAGQTDTDYDTGVFYPVYKTATTANYALIQSMYAGLKARMQGSELVGSDILCFVNEAIWSKFGSIFQGQTVLSPVQKVDAGFETWKMLSCEFMMDSNCPGSQTTTTADNYIVMFAKDALKFYYRFGFGSKSSFDGEVKMPVTPIRSTRNFIVGNLVATNRRMFAYSKVYG